MKINPIHSLISWMLIRFTDFSVTAWSNGRIAGISSPQTTRAALKCLTDNYFSGLHAGMNELKSDADYAEMVKRIKA